MRDTAARPPRAALALGLFGLLPFAIADLALTFPLLWPDLATVAHQAAFTYGAVVLGFLGGVRWALGMAKRGEDRSRSLALSVMPALIGWFALFTPGSWPAAVLIIGFAGQGFWDVTTSGQDGAPPWYPRLRMTLTGLACALLAVLLINGP